MSGDTRKKNQNWTVCEPGSNGASWNGAQLAVLMDIRDELQRLNALLNCSNFLDIPHILRAVKKNTTKKKRPARGKPKLRVVR